jgi:hypothetical protein
VPGVLVVPGIAVELPLVAIAWVIVFTLLSVIVIVGGFLQKLADFVPLIGGALSSAIGSIVDSFASFLTAWLAGTEIVLHDLWVGISTVVDDFVSAMEELGGAAYDGLTTLRHVVLPAVLDTVTWPIRELISAVETAGAAAVGGLWAFVHALDGAVAGWLDWIRGELAGLGSRLAALEHLVLDGLTRRLDYVIGEALPALRSVDDVLGRGIDRLRDRLDELVHGELAQVIPWALAIAGSISAVRVIEAVRTVETFKPKSDRLCTLDLDDLEDLLGFALTALTLTELVALVREGLALEDGVVAELRELI